MKKIISIIVLSIVGLLVAATITLAIVPVSTYDAVKGATQTSKSPDYITVYKNGKSNTYLPGAVNYETVSTNIKAKYEDSLKASILSSFFQGAMSYDEAVEKSTTSGIDNVLKTNGSVYVEFNWNEAQTLYFDGAEYKVTNNKTEKTVSFTSLAVEVKNTDAYEKVTVYVIDNSTSSSRVSNYKISTLAHQKDLYNYIISLEIKGTL